jgi:uncharacterized membrane protein YeaQ/YmgE (transglycosylase-associated protein family)
MMGGAPSKSEANLFTLANLITWVVVGLIGGSLAGLAVTRQRAGFGLLSNLALGCAGAILGGALFELFNLLPELDKVSISARDILAAFIGSLLVLAARWAWRRRAEKKASDRS